MDIKLIESLFGRPLSDRELTNFLSTQGIDAKKDVVLDSGLFTVHVEKKELGFSLTFTDEAMYLKSGNQEVGTGDLYFTGVFFYRGGKDGYTQYQGELPSGIDFSDSAGEVEHKLGDATFQRTRDDGSLIGERWDFPDFSLSVTYWKHDLTVALVSLYRPY